MTENKRIGLLVPSSNTVMEVDFYRHLPATVSVHAGRMYLESTTEEGEAEMLDVHALPAAKILATARPHAIVFGCTSAGALRGDEYDRELCQRISDQTGSPAISVIESVRRELKSTGARKVAVLTPYVEELNRRIQASLEADGMVVAAIHGMGISVNFDLARVEPEAIVAFAKERFENKLGADALLVCCTNYQALAARNELQQGFRVPVVTSNQAALAAVCRALHVESRGLSYDP